MRIMLDAEYGIYPAQLGCGKELSDFKTSPLPAGSGPGTGGDVLSAAILSW